MNNPVEKFFETQVQSYSENFELSRTAKNHSFQRRLEIVCELSRNCRGRLLDCATGSGEITAAVLCSSHFESADLIDISGNMLARTRDAVSSTATGVECKFVKSDVFDYLKRLSGAGISYDLVLCLGLIAHTGRLEELLHLVSQRLTAQGGRLLLQSTLHDHWGTKLVRLLTKRRYQKQKGYAISYYRLSDLRRAIEQNDLRVVEERRFGLSIPFGDRIWPAANFFAERAARAWSRRHGAEIILALERVP
jgi:ubiquinone/menaquinone biosynthesis C-methylase UbiE